MTQQHSPTRIDPRRASATLDRRAGMASGRHLVRLRPQDKGGTASRRANRVTLQRRIDRVIWNMVMITDTPRTEENHTTTTVLAMAPALTVPLMGRGIPGTPPRVQAVARLPPCCPEKETCPPSNRKSPPSYYIESPFPVHHAPGLAARCFLPRLVSVLPSRAPGRPSPPPASAPSPPPQP
jgi:hypothetical protein